MVTSCEIFHENHNEHKTTKFSFFVRKLLTGVAVGNMIEPLVNKEFHIMIQKRMSIMSLAFHLQFYCCFCAFHFSCAISTQTLTCLKCQSFDRSICIGPFSVSFKRSQPAFVLGIKFTLHCKCSFPFDLLNSFKTQ